MTPNYQYFDITISDTWGSVEYYLIENLISKKEVEQAFSKLQRQIPLKGTPVLTQAEYFEKEHTKRYYNSKFLIYQEAIRDIEQLARLDYIFTNSACYDLNETILIERNDEDFDFWFYMKIVQYETKVVYLDDFLDHVEKINFGNDTKKFNSFLRLVSRQYLSERTPIISGLINEKLAKYKSSLPKRTMPTKKKHNDSIFLKKLHSDPEYFSNNPVNFSEFHFQLKNNGFIDKNTTRLQLKNFLSGRDNGSPIVWTGSNVELKWFMDELVNSSAINKPHDKWGLTIEHFLRKGNKRYTVTQLKDASGNQYSRQKLLIEIIKTL